MSKKWGITALRDEFACYPDKYLGKKFKDLLDWSVVNNFFLQTSAGYPCFGLRSKNNQRILSFQSTGTICAWLLPERYPGGQAERDELVEKLLAQKFLSPDWNMKPVRGTREFMKNLRELDDGDINALKAIYAAHCCQ